VQITQQRSVVDQNFEVIHSWGYIVLFPYPPC